MEELLKVAKENNELLNKILSIMQEISSEEYRNKEDIKAFAINLLADIMVEYKSNELSKIVKDIKL